MDSENSLGKAPSPPVEDDRSTKKARFRAQGEDEDNPQMTSPQSFKDTLLRDQVMVEEDIMGNNVDLVLNEDDVVIVKEDKIPSIAFSQRIHDQLARSWKNSIVVKLLGRPIGYKALCNRLDSLWSLNGRYSVIDMENGFYLVRFSNESDLHFVLFNGPWTILGHYLSVQPWSSDFDSTNAKIKNIVAWIRLPGMPLQYYHKRILRMIGEMVGDVIRIDYNTESASRGKFARIAVELDLTKPLVSQIYVDGRVQYVEYENLPKICFQCGRYGHLSVECPEKTELEGDKGEAVQQPAAETGETSKTVPLPTGKENNNPNFGPWMIANTRRRARFSREWEKKEGKSKISGDNEASGSRFNVLTDMADANNLMEKNQEVVKERLEVGPALKSKTELNSKKQNEQKNSGHLTSLDKRKSQKNTSKESHAVVNVEGMNRSLIQPTQGPPKKPQASRRPGIEDFSSSHARSTVYSPNLIPAQSTLNPAHHTVLSPHDHPKSNPPDNLVLDKNVGTNHGFKQKFPFKISDPPDMNFEVDGNQRDFMSESSDEESDGVGDRMAIVSSEAEVSSEEDLMAAEQFALNN